MIGDIESDVLAGKAAGCKTVYLGTANCGQDLTAQTLLEAINCILLRREEKWKGGNID